MGKNSVKKRLNKIDKLNVQVPLKQAIYGFIMFKKAGGISERTESDYKKYFKMFFTDSDLNTMCFPEFEELKAEILKHFSKYADKAPATYNLHFAYLSSFFSWCTLEGYIPQNPIKEIGLKKRKDEIKLRHLETDTIKKLFSIMDIKTFSGYRDYAITVLTMDTGIRPKEIFSLHKDDIDLLHGNLTIPRDISKTRTTRVLPISMQTIVVIKKLISITPSDWGERLFYTCEGMQMSAETWGKRLTYYGGKLKHKITPYMLRHSFAIGYLKNGGNVFALQKELGHVDITMTRRYINISDNDLKEQHISASPLNNFLQRTTRVQKLFK